MATPASTALLTGDDAFHQLEEQLDWIEMASSAREP
jgi:hypothetical protein